MEKRSVTEEEFREYFEKKIAENGIGPLQRIITNVLPTMVVMVKELDRGTSNDVFFAGVDRLPKNFITVGAKIVLEQMPEGEEKTQLQAALDFWKANMERMAKVFKIAA